MDHVTSKDGTAIAFERRGNGPAVILVSGGLDDGAENAPLAAELARSFTTVNFSRRGRGASGDAAVYSVERELEDLDALIAAAGGAAHLYGVSSGGALVLEAAAAGLAVERLAVYEVPYFAGGSATWREYAQRIGGLRRGAAVEAFMRLAGASEENIAAARRSPLWPGLEDIAHTLAYDAAILGDGRPPTARLAQIAQPALVITGSSGGFFGEAADAIAASLPDAERLTLEGQGHVVDATALAPVLERFFSRSP
jgi:pimeloyl-ACP methyl ester carboxylesterase